MTLHRTPAQSTDTVLMVRPAQFYPNAETAANNVFQKSLAGVGEAEILARAQAESDALASALRAVGVEVLVVDSRAGDATPDALFPNNWFSTHADGRVVLYPMYAPNRRRERREDVIDALASAHGFRIGARTDLTALEQRGIYLEGTGSLLIDRPAGVVYVCRSVRSHPDGIAAACEALDLRPVVFSAVDGSGYPIYHTNVMLALGTSFAVVCLEALEDPAERTALHDSLVAGGRQVIAITREQMGAYAGNALEVRGRDARAWLALSTRAWQSLDGRQRRAIESHVGIVAVPIPVIETIGGGGVRCMLAEIFLPRA